jgi:2-iminobutanoate/2-iminopropanoate deaminase
MSHVAGFSDRDLVYVDVALLDIGDIPVINDAWRARFPEHARPARTVYQAAALPYGGRVKIQGVAVRGGGDS